MLVTVRSVAPNALVTPEEATNVLVNTFVTSAAVGVPFSRFGGLRRTNAPLVVPLYQVLVKGLEAKVAPELSEKVAPWVTIKPATGWLVHGMKGESSTRRILE